MFISVLIATKNRTEKLLDCIESILRSSYESYEIIVMDQSSDLKTQKALKSFNKKNLKFYKLNFTNKSLALNKGIDKCKGEIIAFTDDDCIVSPNWLSQIDLSFKKFDDIVGVFGNVRPFKRKLGIKFICPGTVNRHKLKIVSKPCKHWECLGFGNNMAFRKNLFNSDRNMFKTWLGPGSVGEAAEDAELALSALNDGKKLLFDPRVLVYHDRFLNPKEYEVLYNSYMRGQVACYIYLALKGITCAKDVVKQDLLSTLKHKEFMYQTDLFLARMAGLAIGIISFLKESYLPRYV